MTYIYIYIIYIYTVFTQFVLHPQIVPHCGTIRRSLSLFLKIILIVLHPQIIPHCTFVLLFTSALIPLALIDLRKVLSWQNLNGCHLIKIPDIS